MKKRTVMLSVLCTLLVLPPLFAQAPLPSAREILDRIDDLFRGKSSRGRMTMDIKTAHWSRELSMEFWNKGKDKSLIRILSPKKEKGTATLRSGNDIWNYLPKVKRVIKLPSSMMSASWMGSHFNNDDLVKESRMADDYTFEVTFEGEKGGEEVVEITCTPKENAAVVWGKVVARVRRRDLLPTRIEYFDEDMKLARTMTFSKFGNRGGRYIPVEMTIVPADKPGESTLVRYDEIEFDVPLDDDLFSLRSLQR
jgi:outer membrane lipoprotein-sorting protein